ncbi:hypothetical protein WJ972_33545 [Achromobacter insuavis]
MPRRHAQLLRADEVQPQLLLRHRGGRPGQRNRGARRPLRGRRPRRAAALQTVATGVAGGSTAPGRFSGGAVNRKRLRPLAVSQRASAPRYHISPIGRPSLKMQW